MNIICKNLDDTKTLAEKFADLITDKGCFVCLYGDIGAGKTAFTRFVAKKLGIKERITSPSFVILNEYHSGLIPFYHFDLYRLENEGTSTIVDELTEYSSGKIATFIEWAEFSDKQLPFDRIEIKIEYIDEESRNFIFTPFGEQNKKLIEELLK